MGLPGSTYCRYSGCNNTRRSCPGLSFFRFPRTLDRCSIWIDHCQNPKLSDLPRETMYKSQYLCADHFVPSNFMNENRNSLVHDAVPIDASMITVDDTPVEQQLTKWVLDTFLQKQNEIVTDDNACAVKQCRNKGVPPVILHRFPNDRLRVRDWATVAGRSDLLANKEIFQKMLNNYHICSLHFERRCFTNDLKTDLIPSAIPTLFHPERNHFVKGPSTLSAISCGSVIGHVSTVESKQQSSNVLKEIFDFSQANTGEDQHDVYAHDGAKNYTSTLHSKNQDTSLVKIKKGTEKLCRLCASAVDITTMIHIFGKKSILKQYPHKMNRILPLTDQIAENDSLPQWICIMCSEKLEHCNQLIDNFRAANTKLKQLCQANVKRKKSLAIKNTNLMRPSISHLMGLPIEGVGEYQLIQEEISEEICHDGVQVDPPLQPEILNIKREFESTNSLQEETSFEHDKTRLVYHEKSEYTTSTTPKTSKAMLIGSPEICSLVPTISSENHVVKRVKLRIADIAVKRKAQFASNQVNSLTHTNNKSIETEISDDSSVLPLEMNKNDNIKFLPDSSEAKRPKVKCEPDTSMQVSHISIPLSFGNNEFICSVCNGIFDTIESLLTHRFKEHPQVKLTEEN